MTQKLQTMWIIYRLNEKYNFYSRMVVVY